MSEPFLVAEKILEILNRFGSVPLDFIAWKLNQDNLLIERYIQNYKASGFVEYDQSTGRINLKDGKPHSGLLKREFSQAFNREC